MKQTLQVHPSAASAPRTIDALFELYRERGDALYAANGVTHLQHAEQCARAARDARADSCLILSAFLHDVGCLLVDADPCAPLHHDDSAAASDAPGLVGGSDGHEQRGARLVARFFGELVAAPIRMHVGSAYAVRSGDEAAAVRTDSRAMLLAGPATLIACTDFTARSHAARARALRDFDAAALEPGAPGLGIERVRRIAHSLGGR